MNGVCHTTIEAEVRSRYFDDLAGGYSTQKQIITGISFFFSLGAAASLAAETPRWAPLPMASVSAVAAAYAYGCQFGP